MLDPVKQQENERLLAPYRGFTPIELAKNLNITIAFVEAAEEPDLDYYRKNSNLKIDELVKQMANFFGVSEDAVKVRMSYLDLLNF